MENQEFISLFTNMGFNLNKTYEREFYIEKGIDIKRFERILIKADYDDYTDFLLLLFYNLSTIGSHKSIIERKTKQYILKDIPKEQKKARVLKLLMENKHEGIKIEISSPNETVKIKDEEITGAIYSFLIEWFSVWDDELTDRPIPPNKYMLEAIISEFDISKHKITKGAPEKLSLVKDLVVKLILLFRWEDEVKKLSIEERKIYVGDIKPKNNECKLIHDILVFWNLIEDKTNSTNTNTPINYIRTLSNNSKKKNSKFHS